ncbi:MAG: hypothetical protein VKO44_06570, partial [Cyanobacteriota bacterium]|nr:hypothetical protein [Cyanobacteriota bacterium]
EERGKGQASDPVFRNVGAISQPVFDRLMVIALFGLIAQRVPELADRADQKREDFSMKIRLCSGTYWWIIRWVWVAFGKVCRRPCGSCRFLAGVWLVWGVGAMPRVGSGCVAPFGCWNGAIVSATGKLLYSFALAVWCRSARHCLREVACLARSGVLSGF